MSLNRISRFFAHPALFLLEYFSKVSAGLVAFIALGASGSFFAKLGTAFGSLFPVFRQIAELPQKVTAIATIINDYNTLTAAAFNERYGGQAVNRVMENLNNGVEYLQAVHLNLAHQPFSTGIATGIAFIILYLLGRGFRFIRQKGQGSFLTRFERKLGNRFFRYNRNLQEE